MQRALWRVLLLLQAGCEAGADRLRMFVGAKIAPKLVRRADAAIEGPPIACGPCRALWAMAARVLGRPSHGDVSQPGPHGGGCIYTKPASAPAASIHQGPWSPGLLWRLVGLEERRVRPLLGTEGTSTDGAFFASPPGIGHRRENTFFA